VSISPEPQTEHHGIRKSRIGGTKIFFIELFPFFIELFPLFIELFPLFSDCGF